MDQHAVESCMKVFSHECHHDIVTKEQSAVKPVSVHLYVSDGGYFVIVGLFFQSLETVTVVKIPNVNTTISASGDQTSTCVAIA